MTCPEGQACSASTCMCVGCGDLLTNGTCNGDVLVQCIDEQIVETNCMDVADHCVVDPVTGNASCECQPDCHDKECGDDGCGGSCGTCPAGGLCTVEGECLGPDQSPETVPDSVIPDAGVPDAGSDAGTEAGTEPETLPDIPSEVAADSGSSPETGVCHECEFEFETGCASTAQSWICHYNTSGCLARAFTNCASDEECIDGICSYVSGGGCMVSSAGHRPAGNTVDIVFLVGMLVFTLISFRSKERHSQ